MSRATPIDYQIVSSKINELGISDLGQAKIREIVKVVNEIEAATGDRYIRMEMGVPGLEPASVGTEAEIRALENGVASKYANIEGLAELKQEISRFCKLFLDLDVTPACLCAYSREYAGKHCRLHGGQPERPPPGGYTVPGSGFPRSKAAMHCAWTFIPDF